VAFLSRGVSGRYIMLSVWAAGLAAAAGATFWSLSHGPTTAAGLGLFLSMAALLLVNDMVPTEDGNDGVIEWPVAGLTATVLVFAGDPIITMLAVVAAAPLAGLVRRESVQSQVTKVAWWFIGAALGLLVFGVITNFFRAGLITGSVGLVLFYALCEYCLNWVFPVGDRRPTPRLTRQLGAIFTPTFFGSLGAFYGLSRLSSQFGSLGRHVGLIAVMVSIGLTVGCLLGGTISSVWRWMDTITGRGTFLVAVLGLSIFLLPGRLSLAVGTAAGLRFLVVCLRIRTVGGALACVGAIANLVVVQLNGGRMPIDAGAFFRLVGPTGYARYAPSTNLESVKTLLSMLDDRFVLPHPFPFAGVFSVGDIMLGVGLVVLTVEGMITQPRETTH
jgi:Family of unknown function (DUF5317)